MNSAPRIVTLAQLVLLPLGTAVSPVVVEDGHCVFDVQGVLQLEPRCRVTGKSGHFLEITGDLPDIRVVDGRVKTAPSISSYSLPGHYPHRFVVWPEKAAKAESVESKL